MISNQKRDEIWTIWTISQNGKIMKKQCFFTKKWPYLAIFDHFWSFLRPPNRNRDEIWPFLTKSQVWEKVPKRGQNRVSDLVSDLRLVGSEVGRIWGWSDLRWVGFWIPDLLRPALGPLLDPFFTTFLMFFAILGLIHYVVLRDTIRGVSKMTKNGHFDPLRGRFWTTFGTPFLTTFE
jgi:hypothetical protein